MPQIRPSASQSIFFLAAFLMAALLLPSCSAGWVPAQAAVTASATFASQLSETPSPTFEEASPTTFEQQTVDVTVVPDTNTPEPSQTASETPTETITPLPPQEQLATFYAESTQTQIAGCPPGKYCPRPPATRPPTRTPTLTRTPTITPTPTPPFAVLRIAKPGSLSKVISTIKTEMFVKPGDDGRVHLDLIGEDGRYITRQLLEYQRYLGKNIGIAPQIPFEISGVAETSRLAVTTYDKYNRRIALTSVDLVLLSIGENELNLPGDGLEPYLIRAPEQGDIITGGTVYVQGLAHPVNTNPMIIELIDQDGTTVGTKTIKVPAPSGDLSHTPFVIDIPYQISDITPVRLTVRQESDGRIPGTIALWSEEIVLAP
jgi:hypothetical protein